MVFWKLLAVTEAQDQQDRSIRIIHLLRSYYLFNVQQCEKLDLKPVEVSQCVNRIEQAEKILDSMPHPPLLRECRVRAYYSPSDDLVVIPTLKNFEATDHYYTTLIHELVHATGHITQHRRPGVTGSAHFSLAVYSREDPIAELGSAFGCAEIGLDNLLAENSANYIDGWLSARGSDPKTIISASSQARKAADYIQGRVSCGSV